MPPIRRIVSQSWKNLLRYVPLERTFRLQVAWLPASHQSGVPRRFLPICCGPCPRRLPVKSFFFLSRSSGSHAQPATQQPSFGRCSETLLAPQLSLVFVKSFYQAGRMCRGMQLHHQKRGMEHEETFAANDIMGRGRSSTFNSSGNCLALKPLRPLYIHYTISDAPATDHGCLLRYIITPSETILPPNASTPTFLCPCHCLTMHTTLASTPRPSTVRAESDSKTPCRPTACCTVPPAPSTRRWPRWRAGRGHWG